MRRKIQSTAQPAGAMGVGRGRSKALAIFILPLGVAVVLLAGCYYPTLPPLATKLAAPKPILIERAWVFTGAPGTGFDTVMDILIEGDKIARIGTEKIDPTGTQAIDGRGKFVMPGLIDFHTHALSPGAPFWQLVYPSGNLIDRNLSAFLYAGVTTIVDMGSPIKDIEKLAHRVPKTGGVNPQIYYAGRMFGRSGGHPGYSIKATTPPLADAYAIRQLVTHAQTPDDVAKAIGKHVRKGAHFTKIVIDQQPLGVPSHTVKTAKIIVAESEKYSLEVGAHIGHENDINTALDAGIGFFLHAPYRSALSPETITALAEKRATMVTTLVIHENMAWLWDFKNFDLLFSPFEKELLDPKIRAAYAAHDTDFGFRHDPKLQAWVAKLLEHREDKFASVRNLREAGVRMIAGSDSPNVASVPGASLHKELRLLTGKAGFSNMQALAAATYVPGQYLKELVRKPIPTVGHLIEGARADLLILNSNPADDIANTEDIYRVIAGGREVDRPGPNGGK